MRSLDAIHVASLVTFQAESGTRIPFVAGDDRQREAGIHRSERWLGRLMSGKELGYREHEGGAKRPQRAG